MHPRTESQQPESRKHCKLKLKHYKTASLTSLCVCFKGFLWGSVQTMSGHPKNQRSHPDGRMDFWCPQGEAAIKQHQYTHVIPCILFTSVYILIYTLLYNLIHMITCARKDGLRATAVPAFSKSRDWHARWFTLMLLRFRKYWHLVKPAFHLTNCGWKASYLPWHSRIHWYVKNDNKDLVLGVKWSYFYTRNKSTPLGQLQSD